MDRAAAPRPVAAGAVVRYLVGVAGLAFSMTLLWLSMRAVMDIGGACATGGPYVPAVECPDVVVALTPLSIFGLFVFGGLMVWGGLGIPGPWAGLVALGWPALFLSLGWNFLEYGLRPPGADAGELDWSWLFCGVVFVLMGAGPLAVGIRGAREAGGGRSYAGGRLTVRPRGPVVAGARAGEGRHDAAARLGHLARLHRAGDLTDAEFEAAARAAREGGA